MDFGFSDDENALLSSLAPILARHARTPASTTATYVYGAQADRDLQAAGIFDPATLAAFGKTAAAIVTLEVTRLPFAIEVAASTIVAATVLDDPAPRPVALMNGPNDQLVRFLPQASIALIDMGDDIAVLPIVADQVEERSTLFAYPMGRLRTTNLSAAYYLGTRAIAPFRQARRLAIALELAGTLRAALDATIDHVTTRRQFGRAIGSFQAVQHRLAMCEEIVESCRLLALHAAWSENPSDAASAAAFAQGQARQVLYDCQQFHGAAGITLEHPLHLWTYRARALLAEMGTSLAQASAAARLLWDEGDGAKEGVCR
jgi:hypothetical protein